MERCIQIFNRKRNSQPLSTQHSSSLRVNSFHFIEFRNADRYLFRNRKFIRASLWKNSTVLRCGNSRKPNPLKNLQLDVPEIAHRCFFGTPSLRCSEGVPKSVRFTSEAEKFNLPFHVVCTEQILSICEKQGFYKIAAQRRVVDL